MAGVTPSTRGAGSDLFILTVNPTFVHTARGLGVMQRWKIPSIKLQYTFSLALIKKLDIEYKLVSSLAL